MQFSLPIFELRYIFQYYFNFYKWNKSIYYCKCLSSLRQFHFILPSKCQPSPKKIILFFLFSGLFSQIPLISEKNNQKCLSFLRPAFETRIFGAIVRMARNRNKNNKRKKTAVFLLKTFLVKELFSEYSIIFCQL